MAAVPSVYILYVFVISPLKIKRLIFASLTTSVKRSTLWCVQTSWRPVPALDGPTVSCNTTGDPKGALASLPPHRPREPGLRSLARGQATLSPSKTTSHFKIIKCVLLPFRPQLSVAVQQDSQATPKTPTKGPLELPSFISLYSSPEVVDSPDTTLGDSPKFKGIKKKNFHLKRHWRHHSVPLQTHNIPVCSNPSFVAVDTF